MREDQVITVKFVSEHALTQFALVWPAQAPAWRIQTTGSEK